MSSSRSALGLFEPHIFATSMLWHYPQTVTETQSHTSQQRQMSDRGRATLKYCWVRWRVQRGGWSFSVPVSERPLRPSMSPGAIHQGLPTRRHIKALKEAKKWNECHKHSRGTCCFSASDGEKSLQENLKSQ